MFLIAVFVPLCSRRGQHLSKPMLQSTKCLKVQSDPAVLLFCSRTFGGSQHRAWDINQGRKVQSDALLAVWLGSSDAEPSQSADVIIVYISLVVLPYRHVRIPKIVMYLASATMAHPLKL